MALRVDCFARRALHLYAWYHSALFSGSAPVICLPLGSFPAFPLLCTMGWLQIPCPSLPCNCLEVGWISGKLKGGSKKEASGFFPLLASRDLDGWGTQLWLWVLFPSPLSLFPFFRFLLLSPGFLLLLFFNSCHHLCKQFPTLNYLHWIV